MKFRFYSLLFIVIVFNSCKDQKSQTTRIDAEVKPYPHTINIKEGLENPIELKLSDIADSVKYVILSKEKEVVINMVFYIALSDSNIIAHVSQSPFLRFDLNGKFINTIGKIGRGPGEYQSGSSFTIGLNSNLLYIKRNFQYDFAYYNLSGNYIGKLPFKFYTSVQAFEGLSDSRFAIFPAYDRQEIKNNASIRQNMILFGLFDRNGNKLIGINHPAKNIPSDFEPSKFIMAPPVNTNTYFNDEIVTMNYENSIYKINSDTVYTGFKIEWGDLPIPKTFEDKYYIQSVSGKVFARITGKFIETSKNTYFVLNDGKNRYIIEYNKYSGKTRSMLMKDQRKNGFINDLDGGQIFFPFWTNRKGDIWIDFIDAYDMKLAYTDDLLKNSKAINSENKTKLTNFIKDLKIDDNPVLRLVYLKKK